MNESIVYINGQFLPESEAKLPISDRGWRFGDGVFETIRLMNGVPYQWEAHLVRLRAGLEALRINTPSVDLASAAKDVLSRNCAKEGVLRIGISRGNGSAGYLPFPRSQPANVVIEYLPPRPLPKGPLTLWVSNYTRAPLSSLPMNHKLTHGIASSLALMEAEDSDCDEALMLTPNKVICSCASANIFWIKGRHIFTPSLGTGCLAGTMRSAVLRCSEIPIHECEAELATLENAEAIFVTNARLGVWPVMAIQPLGLTFNLEHPLLCELQEEINSDVSFHTEQNAKHWSQY